jgi:hypothetical protein
VLAGCVAVAGLSLLLPSAPTTDPWGWIVWGREIVHLDLSTTLQPGDYRFIASGRCGAASDESGFTDDDTCSTSYSATARVN